MTRKEAIEVMKLNYPDPCFSDLRKAVDKAIKALEQPNIIQCKDCMYTPTGDGVNHHLEFPDDTGICPCQCLDDNWYSWKPDDNFYCGHGKMKEGEVE